MSLPQELYLRGDIIRVRGVPRQIQLEWNFPSAQAQAHGSGVESRVQMMMAAMWPYGVCQESGQGPGPVTEEQLTRRDVSDQLPGHWTQHRQRWSSDQTPGNTPGQVSGDTVMWESRAEGKMRLVQFLFLCNPINNDTIIIRMRMS